MTIVSKCLERLNGKTAWITGGKRIGQIVARALADERVNLVVSYRSSQREAHQVLQMADEQGVQAMAVQADITSPASVERAVSEVSGRFAAIDILVNMASVFAPIQFAKIAQKDWDTNYAAHLLGTFWPIQLIASRMPPGSHIVNIADRTSLGKVYKGYLPYVVTKAAVAALTKAAAAELAEKAIFVNAIAPGPVLRPDDISEQKWLEMRNRSPVKYAIDDREASEQFALLVVYLSIVTMASGYTYPLDQGQNLN